MKHKLEFVFVHFVIFACFDYSLFFGRFIVRVCDQGSTLCNTKGVEVVDIAGGGWLSARRYDSDIGKVFEWLCNNFNFFCVDLVILMR